MSCNKKSPKAMLGLIIVETYPIGDRDTEEFFIFSILCTPDPYDF